MKLKICFVILAGFFPAVVSPAEFNPFASVVVDTSENSPDFPLHRPSPGQFVNHSHFNDPCNALGAPDGSTTVPSITSVVSLGGFGGQIVFAFEQDVEDNPANPYGTDAVVFSNAMWISGNPQWHWSELATIEIMQELNGNTIAGDDPDEKWYLVAGSSLSGAGSFASVLWSQEDFPLPDRPFMQYPGYANWPSSYASEAYKLFPVFQTIGGKEGVIVNPKFNPSDPCDPDNKLEGYWGYAEYTPTVLLGDRDGDGANDGFGDAADMEAKMFYTVPDDPITVGVTAGSGGGDAFDIKWAVDTDTWQPADINDFRYIRITTAVDDYFESLGEISAEIDAVSDVRPAGDIDGDDDVDGIDLSLFVQCWLSEWGDEDFDAVCDLNFDNKIDLYDYARLTRGWYLYDSK